MEVYKLKDKGSGKVGTKIMSLARLKLWFINNKHLADRYEVLVYNCDLAMDKRFDLKDLMTAKPNK